MIYDTRIYLFYPYGKTGSAAAKTMIMMKEIMSVSSPFRQGTTNGLERVCAHMCVCIMSYSDCG